VAGAFSGAIASPAAATHYYAIDNLPGQAFNGDFGSIRSNNFGINAGADFIDNETWVVNTAGTWEETGLDKGIGGYGCANSNAPYFFWADQRPGSGGYHCHQSSYQASYNTEYSFSVIYVGGAQWKLGIGPFGGTSTSAQTNANLIQGGIEMTNQSILTCGSLRDLGWYDANGGSHSGWSDASNGNGYFSADNPPSLYWINTPNWFRDYANESC
jgi:hypothetical protein